MREQTLIYELPVSFFGRAAALYAGAEYDQPAYDAVFEQRQPGRIFVDDAENPSAALLCRTYEYFIAGGFNTALHRFICDSPTGLNIFEQHFGYVVFDAAWQAALLRDLPLGVIVRRNFQWEDGMPIPDAPLPEGAALVRADRLALLEQIDAALPEPFLRIFWGDRAALFDGGFTWCAMANDQIASVMYPVSISQRGVIVGIDTIEAFQRQGYGLAVSAAFLQEAVSRGLKPIWDCDGDNIRSAALAKKLGFREHAPFHELYYADRKPLTGRGVWQRAETRPDGVIVWESAS